MSGNETIEIRRSPVSYPLVTIAIPTYKRAEYLREAVDSALGQENFSDYEVLVCDNSPERGDETEQLMSGYTDSRISYFKNTGNMGMVGNWNRLYTLAKGEWVVMLHDDDMLAPFFLDYVFNSRVFEMGDVLVPSFTSRRSVFMKSCREEERKATYPGIIDLIQFNLIGAPVGMVMRKEVCEEVGGFSTRFYPSQDYHFYVEALLKRKRIVKLLGEPMAYYRIAENVSLRPETQVGFIKNIYEIGQYIISKSPEIYKPFIRFYSKVSSYHAAKWKQKEFPDSETLRNIIRCNDLNFYQKVLAKVLFRIMYYRRNFYFPDFKRQYERD